MRVYYVAESHTKFYGTLEEAEAAAREVIADGSDEADVERIELDTHKASLVEALNGQVGSGPVVYTAKRIRKK